jgi:hypothetical protein
MAVLAPRTALIGIHTQDRCEATEPEEESGGNAEFDDLSVGEVLLQRGEERVVDFVVVGGEELCKAQSHALAWAKGGGIIRIEGGDLVLGQAFLPGPGIAHT